MTEHRKGRITADHPDATPFTDALRHGIAWLTADQPEDAIASHHGVWCRRSFFRHKLRKEQNVSTFVDLVVAPFGSNGRPVVILNWRYKGSGDHERYPWRTFRGFEIDALRALIEPAAHVADAWNGAGLDTASFAVNADVGEPLRRALKNYDELRCAECPRQSMACFCDCEFRRAAYAKLVRPEGWHR